MRFEYMDHLQGSSPDSSRSLINGKRLKLNADGYLLDSAEWSPLVAETFAKRDHCKLNSEQWLLIGHLRRYYEVYQIAPDLPLLARLLCRQQGNCRWTKQHIKSLFPAGMKTACRYAGLPAPVGRCCLS